MTAAGLALAPKRTGTLWSVLAVAAVLWSYFWTVDTSGGFGEPGEGDYYHFLVQGWRQGHLYMSKQPPPEMLRLADPYDPALNAEWRLGDASYFRGHYYLYFGAAPAFLLMLPYDVMTGDDMPVGTAVFVYCVAGFLASAVLWLAIRRRYFPQSAAWSGALGILVVGFGTHVLALARRPLVWELPIAAGHAFGMLALLAVYAAIHGKRPALLMTGAGLSLGLAVASRPTWLVGAVIFVPALWWLWRAAETRERWWKCAAGAAGGMGACLLATAAHNYARFGDALEFGQKFQVSVFYVSKLRLFSPSYLAHNAYIYLFSPARVTAEFPFVATSPVLGGPEGYLGTEPICGIAGTLPFLWFALAVPLGVRARPADEAIRFKSLLAGIAFAGVAGGTVICGFAGATPRYMADFVPTLALLAGCGWLSLERLAHGTAWSRLAATIAIMMGLMTVVMGVLLSFDYHARLFRLLQPDLWHRLVEFFGHG